MAKNFLKSVQYIQTNNQIFPLYNINIEFVIVWLQSQNNLKKYLICCLNKAWNNINCKLCEMITGQKGSE